MTVVGFVASVAAVVIGAFLGMTGVVPRGGRMPRSFGGAAGIRPGVRVAAGGSVVISMPGCMIGPGIRCIRMAGAGVGIRIVVVGMMTIARSVFVTGDGGCGKYKGGECEYGFHGMFVSSFPTRGR